MSPSPHSSVDPSLPPLKPTYIPDPTAGEGPALKELIEGLGLVKHMEGGYFKEIDRHPLIIPNPFSSPSSSADAGPLDTATGRTALVPRSGNNNIRHASTSIYYLLTPMSPQGNFHRNKGRTVHTVIRGRGRYVLIHADEAGEKKRVETFAVGTNWAAGEKSVWVVEGGKFKGSWVLDGGEGSEGLLISETVVPGFEYSDHDFLTDELFAELVTEEQRGELGWLVRKGPRPLESELV